MAPENTTTAELRVQVEETSASTRRVSVTVPRERVERIRRSVASQYARNIRLPGFRKGNIPASLVEKQFGAAIDQETLDRVIQETYREVLERENLQPISQGSVENVRFEKEQDLEYDVALEVQPKLELARTGGFVVARPSENIEDADVDSVLERLRTERATTEAVEGRQPDDGDLVTVAITPVAEPAADAAEGEEAPETPAPEAQPYRFALGEGQAIPDIEQAIMTLLPGEEQEFTVRFPDDFADPEQRGKEERLKIRLDEVETRRYPELDDDFAKAVSGGEFETMDALRAQIRQNLEAEAKRRAEQGFRDALIGQILEANPVEVPESMVERYLDFMTGEAGAQGEKKKRERTPEDTERFSQFRQMLRPQAEASLKRMMVVETLADREGLRATQDDVDARVEALAQEHGRSPADVWLELERSGQLQGLEGEITEEKVFEWLRGQNTIG